MLFFNKHKYKHKGLEALVAEDDWETGHSALFLNVQSINL